VKKILKALMATFLVTGTSIYASGLVVDVNNDMNSIFSKRYGKVHHKNYNLAIFTNPTLVSKLMKKHPKKKLKKHMR